MHTRLIGKNFISIGGAHLHHFWDEMMLHTFGGKVPDANIESSFQAPVDVHNSSSQWYTCHLSALSWWSSNLVWDGMLALAECVFCEKKINVVEQAAESLIIYFHGPLKKSVLESNPKPPSCYCMASSQSLSYQTTYKWDIIVTNYCNHPFIVSMRVLHNWMSQWESSFYVEVLF